MATNHNAFPNSEEVIELSKEQDAGELSTLEEAHERFGIDLDAPEIILRTLEKNGFTMLELEEPDNLPTFEEWLEQRMKQGYSGYNYGCFVINEAGQIGFAKVHYGPDNVRTTIGDNGEKIETKIGGPKRERDVLEAFAASGSDVPEVYGYTAASPEGTPSEEKTYELLVIEAVLPSEGSIRPREQWTPQLARIAAQKVGTFAKPVDSVPLFEGQAITTTVEDLVMMCPKADDDFEFIIGEILYTYPHHDNPVVIHGDPWYNNIIAKKDDSDLIFVDWELAGPGYRGQDAGRKLWDLTIDEKWWVADYTESAAAFVDEWCITDEDRLDLEFGVLFESLMWISERIRDIGDLEEQIAMKSKQKDNEETPQDEREKLEQEIIKHTQEVEQKQQEIPEIKAHALMILAQIPQGK